MTDEFTSDILICGVGAAGLALAIDLARRGVAFRLIDKAEGPFQGSRGKGIQPRTLEVFDDFGIVDKIVAAGGLYPPTRHYGKDGKHEDTPISEFGPPTPGEPYARPRMLAQFMTEAIMRDRLAEFGQAPQFGVELTGFRQDAEGVTATVKDAGGEAAIRARYLIGTDGGRSIVRHVLGVGFPGETLHVRAVVADVTIDGLSRDAWHRWGAGAESLLVCPVMGTDTFQVQAGIPLEGEPDLSASGLSAIIAARTGRADLTVGDVRWSSAYSMNARLADKYRVGRVLLAGDAAHIHPPTGGQGLNTSVQDSYNLGWKLAAMLCGAPPALLDSYEAERRPIAAAMLGLATGLLQAAAEDGGIKRSRATEQLDLGYPGSALALEQPARAAGLRAGDRAPDAPCRGAAGPATRLFSLFRGPHWTLIGYEADRAAVAPRSNLHIHIVAPAGDVIDEGGHIRDAYGLAPGDFVLVRPDGYIGAFVAAAHAAALASYLDGMGCSAPVGNGFFR
jgi:2-polyprenyl-6-methoxyphenol hydroxylase-like FAD-dependent oxidoreductase